jgi:AraC family transcriptional regulator of adaptative response/methylated-DNA-[protein]-cysteine methyltransferase
MRLPAKLSRANALFIKEDN